MVAGVFVMIIKTKFGTSLVTTTSDILQLQMEETVPTYERKLQMS
jgi:hypothetical protein